MTIENAVDISFNELELFNLKDTFNAIILKGLIEFKASKRFGVPSSLLSSNYTKDEFLAASKKWDSILDEMIFAFTVNEPSDYIDDSDKSPYDFANCIIDRDTNVFKAALKPGFTEEDVEIYERNHAKEVIELNKRITKGRILFIKYYDDLWI